MNYSIHIDHDHKLIKYKHSGLILAEDIEKAWNEFLTFKEFTVLKYNLFSDYRNGRFQIPVEFLPEIIIFMQKIENIVKGKKQALIVDEPYSVAASMLFENEVNIKVGFKVHVFTTENAALEWLC
ncbi:MAG: hypothetical protein JEZ14_22750 [Marinilabiliaceae bacterium]|nr:hypothetical protein [Marinilabiliaceae bacterium]